MKTTASARESPADPAAALRWSLTLQALAGALALGVPLLAAGWLLLHALGVTGAAPWPRGPAWLAARALLALAATALAWRLAVWLWVPLPRPAGIRLERAEAPDFHALLDACRTRFAVARPLEVCVTGEMNASIMAHPRGPVLQIGLPLLLSVTPAQCDAILAHEFGHLMVQRVGPGAWAGHLRAWWYRVLDRIDGDPSRAGCALAWALRAADRRYLADGLRLSRAEEFAADALAARAVGPGPLAEALCAVALKEHFLAEDFLPKVRAQVFHRQQPRMLPYRHMASALLAGYDPDQALAAYGEAPEEDTVTHPSLPSRLAKLTAGPWPLPGDAASAAEAYLGAAVPRLAAALDQEWWHAHGRDWQRHHREVQWARRRVASLAQIGDALRPAARLELVRLVEDYCPEWDPLELYLGLLADETLRPRAMLALGRLLTDRDSIEGAGYLLAIVDQDDEMGLAAARRLLAFAERTGRADLARRAGARADALSAAAATLEQAAAADPLGTGWENPGLDPLTRRKLAKAVAPCAAVRRAYLVQRTSPAAGWLTHVLVLRTDTAGREALAEVAGRVAALLPEAALLVTLPVPADSHWEKAAAAVPRARLNLRRRPGGSGR